MDIGLHIADFTFPDGPAGLRGRPRPHRDHGRRGRVSTKVSVMDHLWQIGLLGPPEHEMLEAYTTLGYLAARTSTVELVSWVTAVTYRQPGMLAKLVSTLDVLSGGRAWLGIGAAWNEEEATGLGLPFPPTAERFERLEETLQICLQMWSEDDGPYDGRHYQLGRTLNSPQPLHRPHPPILIGGAGEKKTLRLVAKYAQACNLFPTPGTGAQAGRAARALRAGGPELRRHREDRHVRAGPGREGREHRHDSADPAEDGEARHHARARHRAPGVDLDPLTTLGREVVPAIADW